MAASTVKVIVKWSGKEYEISHLLCTDTVKDLKDVIKLKTGVLPERQKLLGLKLKGCFQDTVIRLVIVTADCRLLIKSIGFSAVRVISALRRRNLANC